MQEDILYRYKKKFPKHTLKTISRNTGIQLTRVFRLFHGQDMKLKEYEAFSHFLEEQESIEENKFKKSFYSIEDPYLKDFLERRERVKSFFSENQILPLKSVA